MTPVSIVVVRPDAGQRVEAGDDAAGRVEERLDAGRVLELVEADDVGVEAGERAEQLVALPVELGRLVAVPAAALEVGVAAADVVSGVVGARVVLDRVRRQKKFSVFIAAARSVPPTSSGGAWPRVHRGM